MSFLHTSRHGLQESELLDFLGYEDKRFPQAHWSTLFLNADHALTYRSGNIALGSSSLREAVGRRYLPNTENVDQARHNLIHCLLYRGSTAAKVRELAWQLCEYGDWSNLATLLSNMEFFELVWTREKWEVMRYWQRLENEGGVRAVLAYAEAIAAPQEVESPRAVWFLAILLADLGYTEPSITLRRWLIRHYREGNEEQNLAGVLGQLGVLLRRSGRLQEALEAYAEEEAIARRLGLHRQVIFSLGNQAIVFMDQGDLPRTRDAYERQKEVIDSIRDPQLLVYYYSGIGALQQKAGEFERALFSYQECARLAHDIGDLGSYQAAIGNEGTAYIDLGRMSDALRSLDRQETICRDINHREGLVGALDNRGMVLHKLGRNDEAMEQHRQAEMIAREIGFHYGTTQAMSHLAGLLQFLKREEEALEYMHRLADMWRREANLHKLQEVLSVAASIRFNRGKSLADEAHYVEAAQKFEQCVADARESGQFQLAEWAEQNVLWNLRQHVLGLLDQKDHANALTFLGRMERTLVNRPQDSVELANIRETMFLTHNVIAADEEKAGRLDAASEAVDSMAAIAELMDDDTRRRQALDCRLSVLRSKGDHAHDTGNWEEAVELYGRARTIALQLEKKDVAELCGTNQIAVLYNEERRRFLAKRFAESLELTAKRIALAETVGNLDLEIDGWSARAYVLGQELGETEAALNAARAGLEKCDPRIHDQQIARFEKLIRQLEEGPG